MKQRITFLASVLLMSLPISASLSGEALKSTVFDWNDLEEFATDVGHRRNVVDQETSTLDRLEIHVTTLNAGLDSHPQHQHAQEEFIILKDGLLDVIINGEAERVGPGSLFFYAANDFHSVRNVGDLPATYIVLNVATQATKSAPAAPAAQSAKPEQLDSSIYDWAKLPVEQTTKGERRELFDSPTVTCANLECHVTTIHAGERAHAAHRHPDEELIIVKDGQLEATINGKSQTAGPGSIFFFASNDLHGLRNVGEADATYYVVRVVSESTPQD